MPIFILVRQLVLLVCINSALIMSPPARTINKTPHNFFCYFLFRIMGYHGAESGIVPRFCEELFQRVEVWPEVCVLQYFSAIKSVALNMTV